MEAVIRLMKHFLPVLRGKRVLIRCDNSTVVQYINKQGGTHSVQLCWKAWDLWNIAISNNIQIQAAHVAGRLNILADHLSRVKIRETEWSLNKSVVQQIFLEWGTPSIDLFASVHNRQTPIFCSWTPHPHAFAVDALSIPWDNMFALAYPPTCLIPKVLKHMLRYHCQIILIAPRWPRRHWYTDILQNLIAIPIELPKMQNLLHQTKTEIYHPHPEILNLTAWLLSPDSMKQKVFLEGLENFSPHHGGRAHRKIIQSNSRSTLAGVIKGKSIPIRHLCMN